MSRRALILHEALAADARPDEQDALVQAEVVARALERLGWGPALLPVGLDLAALSAALADQRPGVVFNLVEALGGRGSLVHLVPAVLDALEVPYTGAGTEAMFLSASKHLTKRLLRQAGLPTPDWWLAGDRLAPLSPGVGSGALGDGPVIVKSVWEEASLGLFDDAVVTPSSEDGLRRLLDARAPALGGECFAERYVEGRELNVGLLAGPDGVEVLPIAEIEFVDYAADAPRIVGYRAKWDPEAREYHHTPRRFDLPAADAALLQEAARLARGAWDTLGCRGYARVDLRVDAAGRPWILEVNANPCLSPDAGYAAALERAGIDFSQAIERIVDDALAHASPRAAAR